MNLVRFYTIGSALALLMEIAANVLVVSHKGRFDQLCLTLLIPMAMWFCISGIFIVVFILRKVPFWSPLAYVVYCLTFVVLLVIIGMVSPELYRHTLRIPVWLGYVGLVCQLAMIALNIHLLVSYKPRPEDITF